AVAIFFFFQAEDGIRDCHVTGVQTCALPIYSGNFVVAISTDNGATYTDIDTIVNDGVSVGWQTFDYDLSAYAGEYVRIRITAVRTTGDYYLAFDNFYIGQPITCVAPHGLTVSNITHNSAVLNWESDGENFEISWGEGNFDPEDGTIEPFNNGGTLSGLNSSTIYRFYVRQVCSAEENSVWAGPFSFTTLLANDNIEGAFLWNVEELIQVLLQQLLT